MPKIQAEDRFKFTPFRVRIREDIQHKVLAYCHYLNPEDPSSPGYVLTEGFKRLIEKDAEFETFLKTFQLNVSQKKPRASAAKV